MHTSRRTNDHTLAYVTDGSVHSGGIINEQRVIDFLNSINYYPEEIKPLGGTQHKADAIAGDKGISIKRKKDARKGSFDYLNSSQLPLGISDYFTDVLAEAAELRLDPNIDNRVAAIQRIRSHMANSCRDALNSLTPQQVTEFLGDAMVTRYKPIDLMAVTNAQELNLYKPEDNPVVQQLSAGDQFQLQGKAKGSRRVAGTNLRVRLTTNNGIGALLGLSEKNKNSIMTIKLQQDRIPSLLNQVNPTIFDMGVN